jgi:hypothetical protein
MESNPSAEEIELLEQQAAARLEAEIQRMEDELARLKEKRMEVDIKIMALQELRQEEEQQAERRRRRNRRKAKKYAERA